MGFTMTIEGSGSMYFGEEVIQSANFALATPEDSRAKSTNHCVTMSIVGKLYADNPIGGGSQTIELLTWAQTPAESEEAYRNVTIEVISSGIVFRKIQITKAFVVDYNERYAVTKGVGEFSITIRQKADKVDEVKVEGGAAAGLGGAMGALAGSAGGADASIVTAPKQSVMQKAVESAGKAATAAVMQKILNKVDPSGAASAAASVATENTMAKIPVMTVADKD